MSNPDERQRPSEAVTLSIPVDTLELVRRGAKDARHVFGGAAEVLRGPGAARLFSERIMQTTAEVLARHIPSEEERSAILREIQVEAA
jgi:hypothetical protein